jgi:hypothetical protein
MRSVHILEHSFHDADIEYAMVNPDTIELGIRESQSAILLNKADVIALAKCFDLETIEAHKEEI